MSDPKDKPQPQEEPQTTPPPPPPKTDELLVIRITEADESGQSNILEEAGREQGDA